MDKTLILQDFLPYRLSVLSNRISRSIAQLYEKQFRLTMPEWRVMAILGEKSGLSAGQVADRTAMDKVAVSRAVASLMAAGRLDRKTASDDRRRSVLSLSKKGKDVYAKVVPLACDYEARLIERLSPLDRRNLDVVLSKLTEIQIKTAVPGETTR